MPQTDRTLSYCTSHTTPPSEVLLALERATHLRTLSPQMLSGPYQGALLQMFSQMIRPRRVLEIGTFTGYAAICLAQGLTDDGLLHTIEVNDELAPLINEYVDRAGLNHKIRLHLGDAAQIVPTLNETFDLVFLDAGKLDYDRHYEMCLPLLRPGGFLLADNVIWDNRVPDPNDHEATVVALRTFNTKVHHDSRVDNLLLPLRDGLMLVRKR